MATSGPNNPGTLADDSSFGTEVWASPGNAAASDDVDATVTLGTITPNSHYLKATNFSFSIPGGSIINGITVGIEKAQSSTGVSDTRVRIVKGGTIGATDKSAVGEWPAADAYSTYGGASDLWGETWTTTDINASDFGVAIAGTGSGPGSEAQIDHIRITIDYTVGGDSAVQRLLLGVG